MGTVEENSPAAHGDTGGENPFKKEFGTFVKEMLETWKVPGMSLAIIDGEHIYAEVTALNNSAVFIY
jgi:hypothetical protein